MMNQNASEKVMHDGLMESYLPYLKADSLGELPDEKGKIKNKFRKDISGILRANHLFYINGGVHYSNLGDHKRAADFFEVYWNIPSLPMFEGQNNIFVLDSTYQTIKYYAIISSISAEQHERALAMLERITKEPFIENSAYKESDVYELMANEYLDLGDSAKFVATLNLGAGKFPSSKYFIPNLINVYIRNGEGDKAMEYLDQAIANDPANSCDLNSVKGALLTERSDYVGAEVEYKKALTQDPNCERALENLARNYIIQAQNLKEITATLSNRQQQVENDKKTVELYQESLPLLEKLEQLLKERSASEGEVNGTLMLLRNVYYNLSVLGVDKSTELKVVENQLNLEN
jgi:tetratricopeptide (TPR) repeat protein